MSSRYSPDLPTADEQAETLADGRRQADDFYDDPLGKYNEKTSDNDEKQTDGEMQTDYATLQTQNDNSEFDLE